MIQTLRHLQNQGYNSPDEDIIHRSPSVGSDTSKTGSDSIISSEWSQVESIDLINDGTGLGFGIVGMKNMGVVVKTILPGGVADRDGRLQSGDHILQVSNIDSLIKRSSSIVSFELCFVDLDTMQYVL